MSTEVLAPEKLFSAFEPKVENRFIVEMTDVPSYVISDTTLPKFVTLNYAKHDVYTMTNESKIVDDGRLFMRLYDPVEPSTSRILYDIIKNREGKLGDITIKILGPVGDVVSIWKINTASIYSVDFGRMSWTSQTDLKKITKTHDNQITGANKIELTVAYREAILEY